MYPILSYPVLNIINMFIAAVFFYYFKTSLLII